MKIKKNKQFDIIIIEKKLTDIEINNISMKAKDVICKIIDYGMLYEPHMSLKGILLTKKENIDKLKNQFKVYCNFPNYVAEGHLHLVEKIKNKTNESFYKISVCVNKLMQMREDNEM